jgi:hypothetical protein
VDWKLVNSDLCLGQSGALIPIDSNELNASYAADGYARVNGTPGALITTYVLTIAISITSHVSISVSVSASFQLAMALPEVCLHHPCHF